MVVRRATRCVVAGIALVVGGCATTASSGALRSATDVTTAPSTVTPSTSTATITTGPSPATAPTTSTTVADVVVPATTSPATETSVTETPATETSATETTAAAPPPAPTPTPTPTNGVVDPAFPTSNAAFDALAAANRAVSFTVIRDGAPVVARASGTTIDGAAARPDSPMVVASVSKLVTALTISRLAQDGLLGIDEPVPWDLAGVPVHPAWRDVTVRELLDHRSGMPVVRTSWFDTDGDCASFLPSVVDTPPTDTRGTWRYSNGNYCALGLVAERLTGEPLDALAQRTVFDPLGIAGIHATPGGQWPTDIAYGPGVSRLDRLGGAGSLIVATSDVAAALAAANPLDRLTLSWPGVMIDQYGWGHTGTVDGAKACAWVLEGGRTVAVAAIAGNSPGSGGGVCDRIVPAVATDLGVAAGTPQRTPP